MAEFAESVALPQKPRIKIPNPLAALASRLKGNKSDDTFQEATIGVKEIASALSEFDQVRSLFTESQTQTPPERQNWSSVLDDLENVPGIAKVGQVDSQTGQDLRAYFLRHRNIIPGKGSYGGSEIEWIVLTKDGPRVVIDGTSIMSDAIGSAAKNPDVYLKNAGYDGHFIRLGGNGHTVKVEDEIPDINLVGETIRASIQDAQDEKLHGRQISNSGLTPPESGLTTPENSDTLKVDMEGQGPKPEDLGATPPPADTDVRSGLPPEVSTPTMDAGDDPQVGPTGVIGTAWDATKGPAPENWPNEPPKTLEEARKLEQQEWINVIDQMEEDVENSGWYFAKFGEKNDSKGYDSRVLVLRAPVSPDGSKGFMAFTKDGIMTLEPTGPPDANSLSDFIDARAKQFEDNPEGTERQGFYNARAVVLEEPRGRRFSFATKKLDYRPATIKLTIAKSKEIAGERERQERQKITEVQNSITTARTITDFIKSPPAPQSSS